MKITKNDILNRLQEYPTINQLFSRPLIERQDGNWFSNRIIRSLYRTPMALQDFEEILKLVFEKVENASWIISKLVGTDKEFDQKILHLYAEILASKWFIDKGFECVKFMKAAQDKPSPDLGLHKGGIIHFAEVKYLETTADELTPMLSRLEELETEHPAIYEGKSITIKAYTPSVAKLKRIRDNKERDHLIGQLIKHFHETMQSEKDTLESELDTEQQYTIKVDQPLSTEFQIKRSKEFMAFLFHPMIYGHRITAGTEFFHYGSLYAKLIGRIHEAYLQLLTNRGDVFKLVRDDFVYLYIEPKSSDILYQQKIETKINRLLDALGIGEVVQVVTSHENILRVDEQICPVFSRGR